jgi:hypothetical protein
MKLTLGVTVVINMLRWYHSVLQVPRHRRPHGETYFVPFLATPKIEDDAVSFFDRFVLTEPRCRCCTIFPSHDPRPETSSHEIINNPVPLCRYASRASYAPSNGLHEFVAIKATTTKSFLFAFHLFHRQS